MYPFTNNTTPKCLGSSTNGARFPSPWPLSRLLAFISLAFGDRRGGRIFGSPSTCSSFR
ncbi:hypothetical protein EI94DRAFT_1722394 [Lactarius quietus]|nr:hypothetical protein EI94DRAFT_1722394 [Lactarius quietus]